MTVDHPCKEKEGEGTKVPSDMRQWLRDRGHSVGPRGRIAAELKAIYDQAHGTQYADPPLCGRQVTHWHYSHNHPPVTVCDNHAGPKDVAIVRSL